MTATTWIRIASFCVVISACGSDKQTGKTHESDETKTLEDVAAVLATGGKLHQAATYETTQKRVHPVVFVAKSRKRLVGKLPAAWRPDNVSSLELVAVLEDPETRRVGGGVYSGSLAAPRNVARYQRVAPVTLYEARTGRVVARGIILAKPPRRLRHVERGDVHGEPVTIRQLEKWLRPFATGAPGLYLEHAVNLKRRKVKTFVFSPKRDLVAARGVHEDEIRVFSLPNLKHVSTFDVQNLKRGSHGPNVAFAADNTLLLAASVHPRRIAVFDLATERRLDDIVLPKISSDTHGMVERLVSATNELVLAHVGFRWRVIDVTKRKQVKVLGSFAFSSPIAVSDHKIATNGKQHVEIWNMRPWSRYPSAIRAPGLKLDFRFSRDGASLFIAGKNGILKYPTNPAVLKRAKRDKPHAPPRWSTARVHTLAKHPDGKRGAFAVSSQVTLVDALGKPIATSPFGARELAFSRDGKYLFGADASAIRVWRLK